MTSKTTTTTTKNLVLRTLLPIRAQAARTLISERTTEARMVYGLTRDEYRAAADLFAEIPSAAHYVALQRAALALQDARSAQDEARQKARLEAEAHYGEDALMEAGATLTNAV